MTKRGYIRLFSYAIAFALLLSSRQNDAPSKPPDKQGNNQYDNSKFIQSAA